MVKGVAKYAVVVRGTGADGFSDAIFISDSENRDELFISSADDLLKVARKIAGEKPKTGKNILPHVASFAGGAIFAVLITVIYGILK